MQKYAGLEKIAAEGSLCRWGGFLRNNWTARRDEDGSWVKI